MSIMTHIRRAAQQRAAFNRTRAELRRMPLDVQLDLGLYSGDADRIAREAVYGA